MNPLSTLHSHVLHHVVSLESAVRWGGEVKHKGDPVGEEAFGKRNDLDSTTGY